MTDNLDEAIPDGFLLKMRFKSEIDLPNIVSKDISKFIQKLQHGSLLFIDGAEGPKERDFPMFRMA